MGRSKFTLFCLLPVVVVLFLFFFCVSCGVFRFVFRISLCLVCCIRLENYN